MSRFASGANNKIEKKKTIIQKLKELFDKFKGLNCFVEKISKKRFIISSILILSFAVILDIILKLDIPLVYIIPVEKEYVYYVFAALATVSTICVSILTIITNLIDKKYYGIPFKIIINSDNSQYNTSSFIYFFNYFWNMVFDDSYCEEAIKEFIKNIDKETLINKNKIVNYLFDGFADFTKGAKTSYIDMNIELIIILLTNMKTEEFGKNKLKREFNDKKHMEVITSDLTYVNVSGKWHYICLMLDLFNREIVGYSAGPNKDAGLVVKAFASIKERLNGTKMFHSDRGHEFKNSEIDKILNGNDIKRSLSKKGCPFDNAVSEATYKIIKTEFAYDRKFISQEELDLELFDYVNWYNNKRIHGTLGYKSPKEFREISLIKVSS